VSNSFSFGTPTAGCSFLVQVSAQYTTRLLRTHARTHTHTHAADTYSHASLWSNDERQIANACFRIAYVSIRQHTSACSSNDERQITNAGLPHSQSVSVYIRQHTSAYERQIANAHSRIVRVSECISAREKEWDGRGGSRSEVVGGLRIYI
jgi:hypothetical protein